LAAFIINTAGCSYRQGHLLATTDAKDPQEDDRLVSYRGLADENRTHAPAETMIAARAVTGRLGRRVG
jgi:hypothetical protein